MDEHRTSTTDRRRFMQRVAGLAGAATAGAAIGTGSATPAGAQDGGLAYVPLAVPYRTYDSRNDADGPITPGGPYVIDMADIPADAVAVTINLTVVDTTGPSGYLTVWGQGRQPPGVMAITWFGEGQILTNMISVATGETDNDLSVACGGAGSTHFLVDVYGWYL